MDLGCICLFVFLLHFMSRLPLSYVSMIEPNSQIESASYIEAASKIEATLQAKAASHFEAVYMI